MWALGRQKEEAPPFRKISGGYPDTWIKRQKAPSAAAQHKALLSKTSEVAQDLCEGLLVPARRSEWHFLGWYMMVWGTVSP